MKFIWQRSRTFAIAAVAMEAAGAAVAVGRPHMVSEPLLAMEWQCSRTALVTICSQSREAGAAVDEPHKMTAAARTIKQRTSSMASISAYGLACLSLYALAAGLFRTELLDVLDAFRSRVTLLTRCFMG